MNTTATSLTRTFEEDGTIALRLDNERGDVRIRTDDGLPAGTATVELRADRDIDFTPVVLHCRDGILVVDVPALLGPDGGRGFSFNLGPLKFGGGDIARVDITIALPEGTDVQAKTKTGDITCSGTSGATRLTTGSGDIRVDRAGALQVTTGSGDVTVSACTQGTITTGTGDLRLTDCSGPGNLQLRSGSGDIAARSAADQVSAVTGSGDVLLSLDAGELTARTGTGDVEVRVPRDIPVWLDLNSGLGDVERRIDAVGPPQDGQSHLSISARSGTGDILITH